MRIIDDPKLDFSDVLIVPKRSEKNSRQDVDLERTFKFRVNPGTFWKGVPIVASNMDTVGTFEMARTLESYNLLTCIHKHYTTDQWKQFLEKRWGLERSIKNVMYSLGTRNEDYQRWLEIKNHALDLYGMSFGFVCVDIANGYSQHLLDFISKIRTSAPSTTAVVAGNVVTPEMTEALILAGADIVKVGIGGGSVCTTRLMTGVGYPQLSAVIECADAAHGIKGHIISDGGCAIPGDIAKAFGGGADFVMLGGMLAGHKQAGPENFIYEDFDVMTHRPWDGEGFGDLESIDMGKKIIGVKFYGMSSEEAMDKYYGGVATYRASEGKETVIPYRGDVEHTVQQLLGGLRSACTYIGADSIKEMPKRTTFIKAHKQYNDTYNRYEQ